MRHTKQLISLILMICMMSSMTIQANESFNKGDATLGLDTEITYTRTPQESHIIIDKEGYLPSAKKVFYIYGSELGQEFQIINMKSDEVVYSGTTTMLEIKDKKQNMYIGDFSDLSAEGTYRLYQDDVGYSDEFIIDSDIYKDMYDDVYAELKSYQFTETEDLIFALSNIMLTEEIYPETAKDDEFVKKGIDRLINMREELASPETTISPQLAAMMAGVLGQYYHLYKDEDLMYANTVLSIANSAYILAERSKDEVPADIRLYAACMLYRVNGYAKYLAAINEYDTLTGKKKLSDYNMLFAADIAYLNTTYRTDYNRCEELFASYVNDVSQISLNSDKMHFYVQADIDKLDDSQILDEMMRLGMVSYVLSSHEYSSIQGNYLHYMFGVNEKKCNHLNDISDEEEKSVREDILMISKLLFILGNAKG